jgi:hypothetical protein
MLGNDSLANYYKTNFGLMQFHKYNLTTLEDMIPWEKDLYIVMLLQHLEKERQKAKEEGIKQKKQQPSPKRK